MIWEIGRDVSSALGVAVLDFALLAGLPGGALFFESRRGEPPPGTDPLPGLMALFGFIFAMVLALALTVTIPAAVARPANADPKGH